ncbi:glycosyltransferase family protein [Leptospira interrogans]|uniref:glycosyltransferase family protein n=1 Tax=Leptospira TaxID=171 RepID=UPI000291D7BB|nr:MULTISPECIES: glycosyltransferase family protein [Leptospira]EKO07459.1 cytidylyltransferase [Leptospira interrogans str. C10069]EMN64656.1 cytidylyltransferase [Leptospira interrogans serovar Pyrogenes str. R168]ULG86135.1 glycosyltransferase family protein [Leptospira interrogans]ULG90147.1 glycosyltransferase family protein [Leptospira interrogans]
MNGTRSTHKVYAFIQARTGSSRLPEKVLLEFPSGSGKTLVDRIYDRILTVLPKEQIVYLIPKEDKELRYFLNQRNYLFFAGDLLDVRRRYIEAAHFFNADSILRLTGDNPFYDTIHLDQLLQSFQFFESDLSYVSGLPLGMGGEIFTRKALEWTPNTLEERHKEHVSLHIKENSDRFRITKLSSLLSEKEKLILPKLRLTIDEPKDFETTSNIFNILNEQNPIFGVRECINLFEIDPNVFAGNQNVEQIRFQTLPSQRTKKFRIGVFAGDPKDFGSGHFERSRILFALLATVPYETFWLREFPKEENLDLLIVDSRDISIPEYSKTKVLLLDHFGSDRKKFHHYDLLPHSDIEDRFSLDQILIPPGLFNLDRKQIDNSYILCYAGNIDHHTTFSLDSFLESLSLRENIPKIVRIGGTSTTFKQIEFIPRVSKFKFQNLLATCSGFVSYFGQSLFEAIFLDKKVCTYSISPVHSSLSLLCEKKYGIPFAGDLNSTSFENEVKLQFSSQPVSGKGYPKLLQEIERILSEFDLSD